MPYLNRLRNPDPYAKFSTFPWHGLESANKIAASYTKEFGVYFTAIREAKEICLEGICPDCKCWTVTNRYDPRVVKHAELLES